MTLTAAAARRVGELLAAPDRDGEFLRVGVRNGGCAGMAYTMDYAAGKAPLDEVVEAGGAKVLVDAKAVLFLLGAEMDYEVSKLKAGFVFRNPNQTSACGCGESVSLVPATAPPELEGLH
jgi:iron-sulfur cluster assembly protein